MKRLHSIVVIIAIVLGGGRGIQAADRENNPTPNYGPYFLGHETEPAMDYGGRVMLSLHTAGCDLGSRLTRRIPYVAPAYELPLAILFSTLQHEIHGHGSRGREYDLKPSYGFGVEFSAYTTLDRDPGSNEELSALAAGGTEANAIMARRILLDFCRTDAIPASSAALMFLAKLDLSLYTAITSKPRDRESRASDDDETSFVEQYEEGNDIAIYLATRQAQRRHADPVDVWRRDYVIDFDDPLLDRSYRHTQDVALWNALDPMMWATMFFYVKEHVIRGDRYLPAPALPMGNGYGVTVGTRGSIEPQSVSRFLDIYLLTPIAVFGAYGRDLRSTENTTYGAGIGAHRMALGSRLNTSFSGDIWEYPNAPEALYDGVGWNMNVEIEFSAGNVVGAAFKAGYKNKGYFPGTPTSAGAYFGAGLTATF